MKKRNGWHGHLKEIAARCGCSTTSVSKILNGKSSEVTNNLALIENVRTVAAELIEEDIKELMGLIQEKSETARQLAA